MLFEPVDSRLTTLKTLESDPRTSLSTTPATQKRPAPSMGAGRSCATGWVCADSV